MANNRNTVRDYGLGDPNGYLNHATHATVDIVRFDFDNFTDYSRNAARVWAALDAARAGARQTRRTHRR